jgi:hypothetical protein
VLEVIRKTPGVVKASPLIEEALMFREGPHGPESVQVTVDLLAGRSTGFRLERQRGRVE